MRKPKGYQLEHRNIWLLGTHDPTLCEGRPCTIHNRTDHAMRAFPQHWRDDRKLMERLCPHGVGHPDPDEHNLDLNGRGIHGCDGCCHA